MHFLFQKHRRVAGLSLSYVYFVVVSAVSGFVLINCICWSCCAFDQPLPWAEFVVMLGFMDVVMGLFYGVYYVYQQRWVIQFPIIQRPLFFSFKMGIPSYVCAELYKLKLPQSSTSHVAIRWASIADTRAATYGLTDKRRISRHVHLKAYAMVDVLRTSIYNIISAFRDEMLESAKFGRLEKDWVNRYKTLFGNLEHLLQKLHLFLEFRAC